MNIASLAAEMTRDELNELNREMLRRGISGSASWPWKEGTSVLFRTVTHYWVGRIRTIGPDFFLLEEASSLPHEGRRHEVLREGIRDDFTYQYQPEVEPTPGEGLAVVMRAAIVDAVEWAHPLPKEPR